MTPAERSLRSRLGGLTTAARGHVNTAPARAAYALSDHAECIACGKPGPIPADTGPEQRAQLLASRRQLHITAIAYRSVRSRAKRKASRAKRPKVVTPAREPWQPANVPPRAQFAEPWHPRLGEPRPIHLDLPNVDPRRCKTILARVLLAWENDPEYFVGLNVPAARDALSAATDEPAKRILKDWWDNRAG